MDDDRAHRAVDLVAPVVVAAPMAGAYRLDEDETMTQRIGTWNAPANLTTDFNQAGNQYFALGVMKGDVVLQVLGTVLGPGLTIAPLASDIIYNVTGSAMATAPAAGSVINTGGLYGAFPYMDLTQYFSPYITQDNLIQQIKRMPLIYSGFVGAAGAINVFISPMAASGIMSVDSNRMSVAGPSGANVRDVDWHPQSVPGA